MCGSLFIASSIVSAMGQEPAAVVEEYRGSSSQIEAMQLLSPGEKIALAANEELVLGYFSSCVRETIKGGEVTIGKEESVVSGGNRKSEDIDCDGGAMIGPQASRKEAAAAVFRKGNFAASLPKPDWTLFGKSPIFKLASPAETIQIERLDGPEEKFSPKPAGLVLDTSKSGISLSPSGLYKITIDKHVFHLKISPLAEDNVPVLSRIVVFDAGGNR